MPGRESLLKDIQAQVRARIYSYTLHAGDRMTQRHISVRDAEEAVAVITAYDPDPGEWVNWRIRQGTLT
jgi:hypothetical protein